MVGTLIALNRQFQLLFPAIVVEQRRQVKLALSDEVIEERVIVKDLDLSCGHVFEFEA